MKASTKLYLKRLVIGTAVAALPQVLLAHGANPTDPPDLRVARETAGAPALPPARMLPDVADETPWLRELDLSEAQRDAIFDLMHAQQPGQRTLEKKVGRALEALHRLAASDSFEPRAARALANDYAQAAGELAFNRAQNDARLRALLTPAQRQQIDARPPVLAAPRHAPGAQD